MRCRKLPCLRLTPAAAAVRRSWLPLPNQHLLSCTAAPCPQYNRDAPRIYNTVQCYLKDSRARLLDELERARREVGWPLLLLAHGPWLGRAV